MNRSTRRRLFAPLISMLLLASPGVGADDPGVDQPDNLLETVIVTAMRSEEDVLEVTEAVSVVGAAAVDRKAPDVLAQMLRGLPGTWFQQTTPGQGIPVIRGLKGSEVLHLVDGMRLNNAFFRNAPNQYLALVDAYATEQTEVIRGSAPSLYGADAMGGVVLILTPEPEREGKDWQTRGNFYGTWNSVDSSLTGRLGIAAGREGSIVSGGVTYQDYGDRRTGDGEILPSAFKVKAADLKWRYSMGEHSELMLSAQFLEQPSTPRVDELVPGYGQDDPGSGQYEFKPNRRDFLHARYRLESKSVWFSRMEVHAARQVITDDRQTRDWDSAVVTDEENESQLDGLTLQFNTPWGGAGDSGNELVWGIEYYADEVTSSRARINSDTGESTTAPGRYPNRSTMDSATVYASNRWVWERFSLEAGLRYSRFDIFLPASEELDATRISPTDFTGDVHFNYQLSPAVRLVSNIGRGFRPPNIFDLGTLGSRPGNRFNVPNTNLKPETVWSYDLGVKSASGRWQAETFVWYSDYRNKISSRLTGEITNEGRLVVTSDNLNKAQLYGVESGLRFLVSNEWQLYAVLNYTRGKESTPEKTVPADRVPPLNGRFGLVYEPGDRWRIEPYLDFASQQDRLSPRDETDPRINPSGTPGWGTLNLLASWQSGPALELGLRLQNIGDIHYREHGSGIDAPGINLGFWLNYAF